MLQSHGSLSAGRSHGDQLFVEGTGEEVLRVQVESERWVAVMQVFDSTTVNCCEYRIYGIATVVK